MLILRDLGGLSLEHGDGRAMAGAGNQPARLAVLAVLARCGPSGISRDRLLALLWPERDANHARGALNQALYALRQATGIGDLVAGTAILRLEPGTLLSDASRFEQQLEQGRLEEAVATWRGPYLDGIHLSGSPEFDQWADTERQRLAAALREALRTLARDAVGAGDVDTAIRRSRALVAIAPHDTEATIGLMRALAAVGDRAGALLAATEHEMRLRRELGLGPDPRLTELVAAIRSGSVAVEQPPATPLGEGAVHAAALTPEREPSIASTIANHPARRPRVAWSILLAAAAIATVTFVLTRRDRPQFTIGAAMQLTREDGLEIDPALSPDGSLVAYAAGPLNRMRVYLRQRSGRALPVTIDSGGTQSHPAWSPDGERLLIIWGGPQGALVEVPALGGAPRVLVADSVLAAAWSPDQREVVFSRAGEVRIMSRDGGTSRRIAGFPEVPEPSDVSWSPDGRFIAFAAGNAMYGAVSGPDFGNRGPSRIYVVPVAGGPPREVAGGGSLNVSPTWGPSGRQLLFVSDRDGTRDIYLLGLTLAGAAEGGPIRLTVGLGAHGISLSRDGRQLAWSAFQQRSNIWSLPLDSGPTDERRATAVTHGNQLIEGLSVSGDGRRLYFDADQEGNADLYRLDLPDTVPVRLTSDKADEFWPVESPDGKWIAFHTTRFGQREVMVMPSAGGPALRVTDATGEAFKPIWTPDGSAITYALTDAGAESGVWQVRRDASGRWDSIGTRLLAASSETSWCPSDAQPFAVEVEVNRAGAPASDAGTIGLPRLDAPNPDPDGLACLPNGRGVVLKAHDTGDRASFWRLDNLGGSPRLIARLTGDRLVSPRSDVATDGRLLYFIAYDRQSDLYRAPINGLAR